MQIIRSRNSVSSGSLLQLRSWPRALHFNCRLGAVLAVFATTLVFGACSTPYTRRIDELDGAYQRGELSREDYMRFVHEAEDWERK